MMSHTFQATILVLSWYSSLCNNKNNNNWLPGYSRTFVHEVPKWRLGMCSCLWTSEHMVEALLLVESNVKTNSPVLNPCLFTAIKIESIGANISATPEGLRLTWKNPYRDKAPHCFESFIRFKTICAPSWEVSAVANALPFHLHSFTHLLSANPISVLSNRTLPQLGSTTSWGPAGIRITSSRYGWGTTRYVNPPVSMSGPRGHRRSA